MIQYSVNDNYKLYQGNMLDLLKVIEPNSIERVVTDPPYELNFMNKGWDNSGIAFQAEAWKKCYEALKPGGYLLVFGGSRTFHRIACAIEDAGFEIRDTIMWLYGSGFPKSMSLSKGLEAREKLGNAGTRNKRKIKQACDGEEYTLKQTNNGALGEVIETTRKEYVPGTNLAKQWEGWGTCLKPSYEPIIVARKPFKGSLVDNVMENGVGGINIDECKVGDEVIKGGTMPDFRDVGQKSKDSIGIDKLSFGQVSGAKRVPLEDHTGRFPANTILTYDETDKEEVCSGFPDTKSSKTNSKLLDIRGNNYNNAHKTLEVAYERGYVDEGSAARYFYCAKASKKDRDEGLDQFETKKTGELQGGRQEGSAGSIMLNADGTTRVNPYAGGGTPKKNIHPTVKPTSLMQYLVRLVTPNGGTVLDPFNGSGSTGKAVMYENKERHKGYKYIGIELSQEYLEISKARIEYVIEKEDPEEDQNQISMF